MVYSWHVILFEERLLFVPPSLFVSLWLHVGRFRKDSWLITKVLEIGIQQIHTSFPLNPATSATGHRYHPPEGRGWTSPPCCRELQCLGLAFL